MQFRFQGKFIGIGAAKVFIILSIAIGICNIDRITEVIELIGVFSALYVGKDRCVVPIGNIKLIAQSAITMSFENFFYLNVHKGLSQGLLLCLLHR